MSGELKLVPGRFTLIGKFGCTFTEVCITLLDKAEKQSGKHIDKHVQLYFEVEYEHQIDLLKKRMPRDLLQHHEVYPS